MQKKKIRAGLYEFGEYLIRKESRSWVIYFGENHSLYLADADTLKDAISIIECQEMADNPRLHDSPVNLKVNEKGQLEIDEPRQNCQYCGAMLTPEEIETPDGGERCCSLCAYYPKPEPREKPPVGYEIDEMGGRFYLSTGETMPETGAKVVYQYNTYDDAIFAANYFAGKDKRKPFVKYQKQDSNALRQRKTAINAQLTDETLPLDEAPLAASVFERARMVKPELRKDDVLAVASAICRVDGGERVNLAQFCEAIQYFLG